MNLLTRAFALAACVAVSLGSVIARGLDWERYRSDRLGLTFESPVAPTDERLVFRGELGDRVKEVLAVSVEVPPAAVSIVRITFKDGDQSTPAATLDLRLRPFKERAPEFKETVVKEDKESKWPYEVRRFSFKDGDETETRIYAVIGEGAVQWLLEGRQVTSEDAEKTVIRMFESAVPLTESGD